MIFSGLACRRPYPRRVNINRCRARAPVALIYIITTAAQAQWPRAGKRRQARGRAGGMAAALLILAGACESDPQNHPRGAHLFGMRNRRTASPSARWQGARMAAGGRRSMVTRAPAAKPAPCFSRACGVHRQPRSPTQKLITHFAPKIIRGAAPATVPQSWRDRIRSACIAAVLCIQILIRVFAVRFAG